MPLRKPLKKITKEGMQYFKNLAERHRPINLIGKCRNCGKVTGNFVWWHGKRIRCCSNCARYLNHNPFHRPLFHIVFFLLVMGLLFIGVFAFAVSLTEYISLLMIDSGDSNVS